MNRVEKAVACFNAGFNCSQAILSTYAESLGMNREIALRIAAGFGAGMGRMAGVCGAVTGANMALSLKSGPTVAEDKEAKERSYQLVQECARRFTIRNGSITCKDLLGCDISTPEGLALAKGKGLFTTICPKLVQDAAEILEEMLGSARSDGPMCWHKDSYTITTDPQTVNLDVVHRLLSDTYWAQGRSREQIASVARHSLCFSLLHEGRQVGFARVVTDHTVFAWIADVIIEPSHRGKGLGKWLMTCIVDHPAVRRCRKLLRTRDAHGLYEKLGFARTECMDCPPESNDKAANG